MRAMCSSLNGNCPERLTQMMTPVLHMSNDRLKPCLYCPCQSYHGTIRYVLNQNDLFQIRLIWRLHKVNNVLNLQALDPDAWGNCKTVMQTIGEKQQLCWAGSYLYIWFVFYVSLHNEIKQLHFHIFFFAQMASQLLGRPIFTILDHDQAWALD